MPRAFVPQIGFAPLITPSNPPKIVLHLKAKDVDEGFKGWHLVLYEHIARMAEAESIDLIVRPRDPDIKVGTRTVPDQRFADGNLHIIDDRSIRMPNVLNCGVAYLWDFWHLDSSGVKAFSSIGDHLFDPKTLPEKRAQDFYGNLRKWYVLKRKSKYDQPSSISNFPTQSIAVFFQGAYPIASGATGISDFEMLDRVRQGADDRAIIVKAHPLSNNEADVQKLAGIAAKDPRLILTDANVHDILEACAITVSINSTVALEGFLHKKPAILFGRSDFHQHCSTIGPDLSFAEALTCELERKPEFEKFLFWYFFKNCIPIHSQKRDALVWEKFAQAGFPKERFSGRDVS